MISIVIKGEIWIQRRAHRENIMWRPMLLPQASSHHKLGMRTGLEPPLFSAFRGNMDLPIPWSSTSSFENCKTIDFCCLSHSVCDTCYGSPRKVICRVIITPKRCGIFPSPNYSLFHFLLSPFLFSECNKSHKVRTMASGCLH